MKNLQMRYPLDGAEAIDQLETLRAKGGEFLLVPRRLLSWLEAFPALKDLLDWFYPLFFDVENGGLFGFAIIETDRKQRFQKREGAGRYGHEGFRPGYRLARTMRVRV